VYNKGVIIIKKGEIMMKEVKFFNQEFKEKFLDTLKESTQANFYRLFKLSFEKEHRLNKDLYKFSKEELFELISNISNTPNSADTNSRFISMYLNYCVEQGKSIENTLSKVSRNEIIKLVPEEEFFKFEKFNGIIDETYNYQDKVALRLIFEGISGKGLEELLNLKISDVNFDTGEVNISGENERKIIVTKIGKNNAIDLIKECIKENRYYKNNGDYDPKESRNTKEYYELNETPYIIRSVRKSNTNSNEPVPRLTVDRRIRELGKYFGINGFTASKIKKSGMLWFAKLLIENKFKEYNRDVVKLVAARFGESNNVYQLKYKLINEENLLKVYPELQQYIKK
jgi:integrase